DLASVIAGAWNDFRQIREHADRTKHPAGETALVPLVDHHVETSFSPYVDIAVGSLPALRVRFDIDFDLELRGVVARIEDAAITGFRAVSCRARAALKGEGVPLFERTRDIALPGQIGLSPGIPIARSDPGQPLDADARTGERSAFPPAPETDEP